MGIQTTSFTANSGKKITIGDRVLYRSDSYGLAWAAVEAVSDTGIRKLSQSVFGVPGDSETPPTPSDMIPFDGGSSDIPYDAEASTSDGLSANCWMELPAG